MMAGTSRRLACNLEANLYSIVQLDHLQHWLALTVRNAVTLALTFGSATTVICTVTLTHFPDCHGKYFLLKVVALSICEV